MSKNVRERERESGFCVVMVEKLQKVYGDLYWENSRVPFRYLPKNLFKPLDVQDYILAIYFQFEIKTPLNRLREESVVAFFLPLFSTILGLNKINIR